MLIAIMNETFTNVYANKDLSNRKLKLRFISEIEDEVLPHHLKAQDNPKPFKLFIIRP